MQPERTSCMFTQGFLRSPGEEEENPWELDTDRAERTATIVDVTVTNVRFPEQDENKEKKLKDLLEQEIPKWQLAMPMDQLLTTMELVEKRADAAGKINTAPPIILFIAEPAVLVTIDGEPRLQQLENSPLMRVINTPFTLLFQPANKAYYLYAGNDTWYTAKVIGGEWSIIKKVPHEVAALAPKKENIAEAEEPEGKQVEPGPPPKIIVSTEPTELISANGKPEFKALSGTDLLYMSNTDSDVLMHIKEQQYYILLAGRWYASSKMEGPWHFVPGEKLPADFAKIPEESEVSTVLYAVPGTDVAKEAVLDAQIPQTAAIDPKKATLTVEYDGDPTFEKITGTKMSYAVNTATPVIKVKKQYYACDEAVWFMADSATGPWRVATSIPDDIYTIPADSPIYHVTFVHIYKVTPEVVYIGYTPGYTHTYVYHTTIVYGTGYWYPGWYGHYYYPYPATWGFHVRYNPWAGWGFGFSYSTGPFTFVIGGGGWYHGGWWGPMPYHSYRHGYRHGFRAGYRAGQRHPAQRNIYHTQRNQARSKPVSDKVYRANARPASGRANNVFADPNGNIHRKTEQGWEQRSKDGWKQQPSEKPSKQSSQRPAQGQSSKPSGTGRSSSQQQLDRSNQARQRGTQRTNNFYQSRGGGGGRRR